MNAPAQITGGVEGAIIKIAVLAVGGQGGGVLTNWIADLATRCGYAVQMTSVAGVAQRTGDSPQADRAVVSRARAARPRARKTAPKEATGTASGAYRTATRRPS